LTTSKGHITTLVRRPAHAPEIACFESGFKCRIVLAGVEEGDGILKSANVIPRSPDEEMAKGVCDANVSVDATFAENFGMAVVKG
jgi:hypothetical protein